MNEFHEHLDACAQCREHPFELCAEGVRLLRQSVLLDDIRDTHDNGEDEPGYGHGV